VLNVPEKKKLHTHGHTTKKNGRRIEMVKQDITKGWEWLKSLSDEEWRVNINRFFESIGEPARILFGFSYMESLRIDIERIHESQLSAWFCEMERIPK
jgi:hypothetical protein